MKHRCPVCKAPTDSDLHPDFPFCGERCRLLDLGAWSSEKYVVSEPVFDEQGIAELDGGAGDRRKKANESIH
jgi:uncharacterized protein